MPKTKKGRKIHRAMVKQYGKEKGEQVFHASKNRGTITGVEASRPKQRSKGNGVKRSIPNTPSAGNKKKVPPGQTRRAATPAGSKTMPMRRTTKTEVKKRVQKGTATASARRRTGNRYK